MGKPLTLGEMACRVLIVAGTAGGIARGLSSGKGWTGFWPAIWGVFGLQRGPQDLFNRRLA
jgi:hypothetical protein